MRTLRSDCKSLFLWTRNNSRHAEEVVPRLEHQRADYVCPLGSHLTLIRELSDGLSCTKSTFGQPTERCRSLIDTLSIVAARCSYLISSIPQDRDNFRGNSSLVNRFRIVLVRARYFYTNRIISNADPASIVNFYVPGVAGPFCHRCASSRVTPCGDLRSCTA